MSSAHKLYAKFHGRASRREMEVTIPDFDTLVVLGKAVAVEYECDKLNGGGDGTTATYRHELHAGDILCADPSGKILVILGPKLAVKEEGIVN
jgi:hypothetical protein